MFSARSVQVVKGSVDIELLIDGPGELWGMWGLSGRRSQMLLPLWMGILKPELGHAASFHKDREERYPSFGAAHSGAKNYCVFTLNP